jgi:hypothetical protein
MARHVIRCARMIACSSVGLFLIGITVSAAERPGAKLPMQIPVVVVKYFPVKGDLIDQKVTGDWGAPLDETRKKTDQLTEEILAVLQNGSRYHGYKDETAEPSLVYRVVKTFEFLEPLPTVPHSGEGAPMTDYNRIMRRIGIKQWVEQKGVKEVWIWGGCNRRCALPHAAQLAYSEA